MTPAKKATPAKSTSFADRIQTSTSEDDSREKSTPETSVSEDTTKETQPESADEKFDRDDESDENLDSEGYIKPGNVVTQREPGVDNQVDNQDDKTPGNPNGVNFSGTMNPINKTPAELSAETPAETAKRFGISDEIPDDVHDNPNVKATRDNRNYQIPGGTHLHPDVAKDNYNRSIGGRTEHGEVTMMTTQTVYATEASLDDKGIKNEQPENLA